ncbi:MAG: DHH family phosphoesterase [Brevinematia bacterium]
MKITSETLLKEIIEILMKESNFLITFHINPDYDAVSSSLALMYILKAIEKKNVIVVSEERKEVFQRVFSFLPFYEEIKEFKYIEGLDLEEYVLIVLDSGEIKRVGRNFQRLVDEFKFIVNIDHHYDNEMFGRYNFVNPDAVCTGEIIYMIAKEMGVVLSKELAMLIYASIVGDSGSFRFDSVRPSTHEIAAKLLETGIKPSFFTLNMFQNKSIDFVKFEGELLQSIKSCCNNKVVWVVITDKLLKKYNIMDSETESVVEDIGRIKDSVVYFVIKEKVDKGVISVALRSKGDLDVSLIAKKFGGGGHRNASGVAFDISVSIEEIEKMVVNEILANLSKDRL